MRIAVVVSLLFVVGCGGSESSSSTDATLDSVAADSALETTPTVDSGCATCAVDSGFDSAFDSGPAPDVCSDGSPTTEDAGDFCPERIPSGACTHPAGYVCWYWPTIAHDTCESCTCVSGTWACNAGSCPFRFEDCNSNVCCSGIGVGCATVKCGPYCRCEGDHAFHCLAHPC